MNVRRAHFVIIPRQTIRSHYALFSKKLIMKDANNVKCHSIKIRDDLKRAW